MKAAGRTHVGRQRSNNEDSILLLPDLGLFAVADGMGGHRGGQVASQMVTDELARRAWEFGRALDGEELADVLRAINERVHHTGRDNPELYNMGSTCVAVSITGGRAHLVHLGDSRAYLWRDGRLRQLTVDHRAIQTMLDRGELNEEEARTHPMRSVLTRSVGVDPAVEVSRQELPIANGDRILLCSDGLSDMLEFEDLEREMGSGRSLEDVVDDLIDAANAAGGNDNISVVVVEIGA